jgi:hypothetical protein
MIVAIVATISEVFGKMRANGADARDILDPFFEGAPLDHEREAFGPLFLSNGDVSLRRAQECCDRFRVG